jgi:hypothetical protein
MSKKVIHIIQRSIFLEYFLSFSRDYLKTHQHIFFIYGTDWHSHRIEYPEYSPLFEIVDIGAKNVLQLNLKLIHSKKIKDELHAANIIVAHALHTPTILLFLLLPWTLKKVLWIVWGEDLLNISDTGKINILSYVKFRVKKQVISKIQYVVVLSNNEYNLIKSRCNPNIIRLIIDNFYPQDEERTQNTIVESVTKTKRILVGHSGFPSGNHLAALNLLSDYKDEDILIYLPLSYGKEEYINMISEKAKSMFGDKIIVLRDFISPLNYQNLLSTMDVGVYMASIQTGLGNIESLLAYGIKVYLNNSGDNYRIFSNRGYHCYSLGINDKISYADFLYKDVNCLNKNRDIAKILGDEEQCSKQWNEAFNQFN